MDTTWQKIDELANQILALQERISEEGTLADEILKQHQQNISWADIYDTAAPEEKRMITAYIVKSVTLSRGYDIQVKLNISEAQYLNGIELS